MGVWYTARMKRVRITSFSKLLFFVLLAVFVLLLIPLLLASRYNLPDSDDLIYGQGAFEAGETTFASLFRGAAETVRIHYSVAHGRYAASFLGAVILHLAGIEGYWLLLFLVLAILISCTLYCAKALFCDLLKADRWTWLALSMLALICWVQMLPSASEGLYWFSGAIAYTIPYSLTMLLVALLLRLYKRQSVGKTALMGICAVLTAAVAAGLGYSLLIPTLALLMGNVALSIAHKRKDCLLIGCVVLAVYGVGCIIQLTAPGVEARKTYELGMSQERSAVGAIVRSLGAAFASLLYWLDTGTLLFIVLTAALLFPCLQESKLRFRAPWLTALVSFCLYATLFAAPFYTLGGLGPDRIRNVYYFCAFWFWGVNVVSVVGWLTGRLATRAEYSAWQVRYVNGAAILRRYWVAAICVLMLPLAAAMVSQNTRRATALNAVREIGTDGMMQRYEQRIARIDAGLGMDGMREGVSYLFYY